MYIFFVRRKSPRFGGLDSPVHQHEASLLSVHLSPWGVKDSPPQKTTNARAGVCCDNDDSRERRCQYRSDWDQAVQANRPKNGTTQRMTLACPAAAPPRSHLSLRATTEADLVGMTASDEVDHRIAYKRDKHPEQAVDQGCKVVASWVCDGAQEGGESQTARHV